MEQDLFINSEKEVDSGAKSKKDFYSGLQEQYARPQPPFSPEVKQKEEEMTKQKESQHAILKTFTMAEALQRSTEYFKGDDLAAKVWVTKYALKNSDQELFECTPDDMHRRIAREIARIEKKYKNPMGEEEIFELIRDFRYIIPQGSPMAGIGNDYQVGSLSNCFVIGQDGEADSYGAIIRTDEEQVQLMKRRGGVGHDLSHIRPTGSPVKNSALTSTGIVPFMERYSNSTREVAQDGRRGALMLSLSVRHPDAGNFIDAKMTPGKVTGANVSIKIHDDFMRAVIEDTEYTQQFPIYSDQPKYTKTIKARELWNKIVHNAWKSAEPGILFWDTITRESVADCYADLGFKTVSTNPCGEIPLCPYDSCRLIAINLSSYVNKSFTEEANFDSALFVKHVHKAQRIMDDIIDLEAEKIDKILEKIDSDPEDGETKRAERNLWMKIKHKTLQGRRTGIGITAEGDMLAALGCRYGSEEATNFSVEVHQMLAIEAYRSSVILASERGPFPMFDFQREKKNPFIQRLAKTAPNVIEEMRIHGRRNLALLTIAPTGSVSILSQTTSGLEPVFSVTYNRRRKVNPNDQHVNVTFTDEVGDTWEEYPVFHHKFNEWLTVNGYNPAEVLAGSEEELKEIIKKSPYYKATANDVDWVAKVKMQGAIQKWVDHSISVTVNLPEDIKEELIGTIYRTAWESGCKGMTVYREGSRAGVLVNNEKKKENCIEFKETKAPRRPEVLKAEVVRFQNDYEKWIAVVGILNDRPYEIFTGKADEDFFLPTWVESGEVVKVRPESGKTRYDFRFKDKQGYNHIIEGLSRKFDKEYWNYARLISGILRHGMPLPFVVHIVNQLHFEKEHINTWKNGVERALKKFIPDGTQAAAHTCPKCHAKDSLIYQEGCMTCKSCGDSKCGG